MVPFQATLVWLVRFPTGHSTAQVEEHSTVDFHRLRVHSRSACRDSISIFLPDRWPHMHSCVTLCPGVVAHASVLRPVSLLIFHLTGSRNRTIATHYHIPASPNKLGCPLAGRHDILHSSGAVHRVSLGRSKLPEGTWSASIRS